MALQDVCRLLNPPVFTEWNAPLSQSSTSEYTTYPARRGCFGDTLCPRLSGRSNISPLEFYIPVAEYLTESPVNFGQAGFSSQPAKLLTVDHLDPSLPSISLPTPTPCSVSPSVPLPFTLSHGTTTLGFAFQGGVIAAADTRSSCSGLVACPLAPKVLPIHSHLVGTTSGTSADCALWKRILARELRLYQLRHNHRLSTGGAAKLLSHMLHPFKGTELCVAVTLCGWDGDAKAVEAQSDKTTKAKRDGGVCGPRVVYVCSDGLRLQGELFSVGSGSPYAYSILDRSIHWDMSVLEATAVAREAVYRATYRDAYSGNNVDLYHVTAEGWRRREREDLKEEYYRERKMEEEKMAKRRAGEKDNKTKS